MARKKRSSRSVWEPVGGSARRYRNKRTGKTISRRQYDNQRARRAGFTNRDDKDRALARIRNTGWNKSYIRDHRTPSWQAIADIEEVQRRRADLEAQYPDLKRAERDSKDRALVAPKGPLARLLDDLGIRPISGAPVGDS